jgi:hypothetical protein
MRGVAAAGVLFAHDQRDQLPTGDVDAGHRLLCEHESVVFWAALPRLDRWP